MGEQVAQATVPSLGRIPVGVEGGGGASATDAFEQRQEPRREAPLQEVRAHVDVSSAVEQHGVDQLCPKVADRARVREDRAVVRPGEHDGHAGRSARLGDQPADVHAATFELVAQEAAEQVVAHDAAEPDAESQPGGTARDDRPRAADGEVSPLDEPLGLAERGLDVAEQHEVGVRVAEDEEVERVGWVGGVGHERTIAEGLPSERARYRFRYRAASGVRVGPELGQ